MTEVVKLLMVYLLATIINSLEVIPERAAVSYINPKYIKDVFINVRRYSRKGAYVLNIQGITLQTFGNNISVNFIFYEFLHNEYKRSFVEMNYKLCDLINKDKLIGPVLRTVGLVCPVPAGLQKLPNMTLISVPAVDNLPYKWPFEKGKVVAILRTSPEKELVGEGYLIASFKQSNTYKKNT